MSSEPSDARRNPGRCHARIHRVVGDGSDRWTGPCGAVVLVGVIIWAVTVHGSVMEEPEMPR
jgi:hypothetical protein